ncbi:MAG: aminotransferase [Acidimicrobiales bacterium]|nr:MAG: aminotransferase [Acidimicrobiales bacterium]
MEPETRRVSRRVAAITPSATLAVDAKAKALRAAGEPVIGFGAGEPDFPTPPHVVEAAVEACRDPANHKYTPAAGLPELREAVSRLLADHSGVDVPAEQILITNGGKHAVAAAFQVLLDDGDEVLVPAPYWTTYPEAIKLAGGVPIVVPTGIEQGFKVTPEILDRACTPRTKALLFVSPSNPTGAVYTREETRRLGEWAAGKGLWVVADEIYRYLTYGEAEFTSVVGVTPELGDRWIILDGVAKTYAMTGWRVGWLAGPVDVVEAAIDLQSHTTSNVANVSQRAALAALQGGLDAFREMHRAFDRRRRRMYELFSAIEGVRVIEPEGAFYVFPSFERFLGVDLGGRVAKDTVELAEILLEVAKVAAVPGEAFGASGYMRFSFALADGDLEEGLARVGSLLEGRAPA